MSTFDELYGGSHVKAEDLQGKEVNLTISGYDTVKFDDGAKLVISFAEAEKTLVTNKTNATVIAGLFGKDFKAWIGKRITLFPTQCDYGGKQVPAIRVKLTAPEPLQAPPTEVKPVDETDANTVPF